MSNCLDTDSVFLARSKVFDDIVLKGKQKEWEKTKTEWFIVDPKDKTPGNKKTNVPYSKIMYFLGLMKVEAEISQGCFIALSPKCYWLGDEHAEKRFKKTNIFDLKKNTSRF